MRGMRINKSFLRGVVLSSCLLWTIYSHVSLRNLVLNELSSAHQHVLRGLAAAEDTHTPLIRAQFLEEAENPLRTGSVNRVPEEDGMESFQQLLFNRSFEDNTHSTLPQDHINDSPCVWLYSLITTDYDGPALIPHFLRHYLDWGVRSHMMYVDLLHDPALSDDGLQDAIQQFQSAGVHTRTVLHAYTPHLQDLAMITGVSNIPMDPEDWVIVADMDEYFMFGTMTSIQEAVQAMEDEGASFALGEMLDHVAPGGALKQVDTGTDIWSQFPLICPIVSDIAKGLAAKVTIHKGYLRSGAGHHHIVEPYLAKAYFGSQCEGVECELVMKRYKQRTTQDVFGLTPYHKYTSQYARTADSPGWQAKRWLTWTKVHHFKWHAAVLDNLLSRMMRDSGNCMLNVNEDDCHPVFQFWQEVARQYLQLNQTRSIDISHMDCKEGIDTLWNW